MVAATLAGCSVDYEVDPNFGALPTVDSTAAQDSTSVDTTPLEDTTLSDTTIEDTGVVDTADGEAPVADSNTDAGTDAALDDSSADSALAETTPPPVDSGPAPGDAACMSNSDCLAGYSCCGGLCKSLSSDPSHCGSCGNVCPTALGAATCVAGKCGYASCPAGRGDCDGSMTCSTVLTDNVSHCGACGNACTVANGTPQCSASTCGVSSCSAGFGDCNTTYSDGCEQPLNTVSHCGACGVACARANATTDCSSGTCALAACNAGYGNCDGNAANGCERSLAADVNNCGACAKVCTTTNGTPSCAAGACQATCNNGYSNCDGNPASCEVNHNSNFNTCATAQALLDAGGSPDLCSITTTESTVATGNTSEGFYKVHMVQCGGVCGTGNQNRVRFTLVNPAGAAYDLRVWEASTCGGGPDGSSSSGTLGGTETVTFANYAGCGTTTRDFWIEVRWRSGRSCSPYQLTATGAY